MDESQYRTERVILETARHRITGLATLARDGYRSRLSDLLNAKEREFISLTEVTIERLDDAGSVERQPFVAISRRHVVLAIDDAPTPSTR